MSTKVWAVEHGAYSDYGIDALFSTKAAAESACKALGGPNNDDHGYGHRVVERPLFDAVPKREHWYIKEMFANKVQERSMVVWPWNRPGQYYEEGSIVDGIGRQTWSNAQGTHFRAWGRSKAKVDAAFEELRNGPNG